MMAAFVDHPNRSDPSALRGVSEAAFRAAMRQVAASVTVVTTLAEGTPHGLTVTAFAPLSLSPPLCLVCIDRKRRSHARLAASRVFAINVLSSEQCELSARFARHAEDRFSGVSWQPGERTGAPLLPDALVWIECRLTDVMNGGDHDIFVGAVVAARVSERVPLVYFRGAYCHVAERDLGKR
jgi:flavin reductase (DIM6/NTAB) family NADH-FMN oxidoreductase RutF